MPAELRETAITAQSYMAACRDKPRLISDGEKMAALYNIACCHSQLEDARSGLVALSGELISSRNSRSSSNTAAAIACLRQVVVSSSHTALPRDAAAADSGNKHTTR